MAGNEEGKGAADGKRRRRSAGGKDEDTEDPKGKRAKKAVLRGDEPQEANRTAQDGAPAAAGSDPLTPAFLLQLIKLLRRKQTLLDKAKQHNDAMTELRQDPQGLEKRKGEAASHRAAGAEDTGKEASLKREYAWCVVQVDRANFMLRNALWGVALGLHAQPASEGASSRAREEEEASARDSLMALSRGEPGGGGDARRSIPRNPVVRKCEETASTLLRAVTSSAEYAQGSSSRRISHGTAPVHPLITKCISLLLLLRNYEEQTASMQTTSAAMCSGIGAAGEEAKEREKERQVQQLQLWEASFSAVLEELRPVQGPNALVYEEIVESIKSLRASISC
eukprot:Tamp_20357.p1 GENE.Tamp_20357~~Tamp_20357.p1  ORF type:complete len:347 (+),score=96.44 Tamp_20357:29-1042(+)